MKTPNLLNALLLTFTVATLAGCSLGASKSQRGLATTDAQSTSAFVEAYLEYAGPPARWAGPGSVLIHLTAQDLNRAELKVQPDLIGQIHEESEAVGVRRISSTQPRPTGQVARERLNYLAESILNEKTTVMGCLYPVRARLVRADGSVVEKFGCRSLQGWPSIASRTVSEMFTIALRDRAPAEGETQRAVASEKTPTPKLGADRPVQ